jgi:hypothetical protein
LKINIVEFHSVTSEVAGSSRVGSAIFSNHYHKKVSAIKHALTFLFLDATTNAGRRPIRSVKIRQSLEL